MNPNEELEYTVTEALKKAAPLWTEHELAAVCTSCGIQSKTIVQPYKRWNLFDWVDRMMDR